MLMPETNHGFSRRDFFRLTAFAFAGLMFPDFKKLPGSGHPDILNEASFGHSLFYPLSTLESGTVRYWTGDGMTLADALAESAASELAVDFARSGVSPDDFKIYSAPYGIYYNAASREPDIRLTRALWDMQKQHYTGDPQFLPSKLIRTQLTAEKLPFRQMVVVIGESPLDPAVCIYEKYGSLAAHAIYPTESFTLLRVDVEGNGLIIVNEIDDANKLQASYMCTVNEDGFSVVPGSREIIHNSSRKHQSRVHDVRDLADFSSFYPTGSTTGVALGGEIVRFPFINSVNRQVSVWDRTSGRFLPALVTDGLPPHLDPTESAHILTLNRSLVCVQTACEHPNITVTDWATGITQTTQLRNLVAASRGRYEYLYELSIPAHGDYFKSFPGISADATEPVITLGLMGSSPQLIPWLQFRPGDGHTVKISENTDEQSFLIPDHPDYLDTDRRLKTVID